MAMQNKPRLCFTINAQRSKEEILSYQSLLHDKTYQGIEIFYPYELSPAQQKAYQEGIYELLKENPEVVLHLPFGKNNDLCDLNNYQNILERLQAAIFFGSLFKATKYTLHLGYVNNEREVLIKHLVPLIRSLCETTDSLIMIENMPRDKEMGYSPLEIKQIIQMVNKANLRFIYDTGHGNVSSHSMEDYFCELSEYLAHTHLSDNLSLADEHKPIGYGTVDFLQFLKLTKDYTGLYCLEILFQSVDDLKKNAQSFYNLGKNF